MTFINISHKVVVGKDAQALSFLKQALNCYLDSAEVNYNHEAQASIGFFHTFIYSTLNAVVISIIELVIRDGGTTTGDPSGLTSPTLTYSLRTNGIPLEKNT